MRNKIVIVSGVVVAIIVLSVGAYFLLGGGSGSGKVGAPTGNIQGEQNISNISGGVAPGDIPAGDTLVIGTATGDVTVKNFYKNALGIVEGIQVMLVQNANYEIYYSKSGSTFTIVLLGGSRADAQATAENDLLSVLGTSKADACRLSVSVIVPFTVDAQTGGRTYPLSFCSQ